MLIMQQSSFMIHMIIGIIKILFRKRAIVGRTCIGKTYFVKPFSNIIYTFNTSGISFIFKNRWIHHNSYPLLFSSFNLEMIYSKALSLKTGLLSSIPLQSGPLCGRLLYQCHVTSPYLLNEDNL